MQQPNLSKTKTCHEGFIVKVEQCKIALYHKNKQADKALSNLDEMKTKTKVDGRHWMEMENL